MSPAAVRIALLPLLLLPLAGCAELHRVDINELHPGSYCEIEMVVPPNAADDSHHCYMGTVQEITHDEVVLTEVLETTNIDYNGSGRRRADGAKAQGRSRALDGHRRSLDGTAQGQGAGILGVAGWKLPRSQPLSCRPRRTSGHAAGRQCSNRQGGHQRSGAVLNSG